MKVQEVMTREVEVIHPNATIAEAAEKMKQLDIGPLPVCDGTRVEGMVTDRDITVRATAAGHDPHTTKVREVMSPDVVYVFEDQDVKDAAKLMADKQIRRLIVLNRDKRLVGIVAMADLAVDANKDKLTGQTLESISEPAHPNRSTGTEGGR
jgi:CBS domain-containing protein